MKKQEIKDPLRRVWKAYCGWLLVEGILLVSGIIAILILINQVLLISGRNGLGVFFILAGLGIAYLATIGILKPFYRWKRAETWPEKKQLPKAISILLPEFHGKETEPAEMREILSQGSTFSHLPKKRLIRNILIFLLGVVPLLILFFM